MKDTIGFAASTARNNAGFKQEYAAEELCISPRTLSAYENNRFAIPDDVMLKMIKLYNAEWLGHEWLRLTFETGKYILPALTREKSLAENALGLRVEMKHVRNVEDDIAEICQDNVIDAKELPLWEACKKEADDLIAKLNTVFSHPIQKETACAGTQTVSR